MDYEVLLLWWQTRNIKSWTDVYFAWVMDFAILVVKWIIHISMKPCNIRFAFPCINMLRRHYFLTQWSISWYHVIRKAIKVTHFLAKVGLHAPIPTSYFGILLALANANVLTACIQRSWYMIIPKSSNTYGKVFKENKNN